MLVTLVSLSLLRGPMLGAVAVGASIALVLVGACAVVMLGLGAKGR